MCSLSPPRSAGAIAINERKLQKNSLENTAHKKEREKLLRQFKIRLEGEGGEANDC